jgi:hypothetical protein
LLFELRSANLGKRQLEEKLQVALTLAENSA